MPADAEHTPERNSTQWQAVGDLARALVREMADRKAREAGE